MSSFHRLYSRRLALAAVVICSFFAVHSPEGRRCSAQAVLHETQEILASDALEGDRLGRSVAYDASTGLLVVGAFLADVGGVPAGKVYLFQRQPVSWGEVAQLSASDASSYSWFGDQVALEGSRLAVAAKGDDEGGSDAGAVYIFEDDGLSWQQTAKIVPDDIQSTDSFGSSVDLCGERLVVGAISTDDGAPGTGSAYVFELTGGAWLQTAELHASDGDFADHFGSAVACDGDRIVVGAVHDDPLGSAYVFDLVGGVWEETVKLEPTDATGPAHLGAALDLEGDRLVVGGPYDYTSAERAGATWVFEHTPGGWVQTQRLLASDAVAFAELGTDVWLDGERLAIGAPYRVESGEDLAGAVYLFEHDGSGFVEVAKMVLAEPALEDRLGRSIAIAGDEVLAGTDHRDAAAAEAGAVYAFALTGFQRGDANGDGAIDVGDAVFALSALFVPGSPAPACADAMDFNDDGFLDVGDPITILSALFVPGAPSLPPPAPCALDPTPDGLDCGSLGMCF